MMPVAPQPEQQTESGPNTSRPATFLTCLLGISPFWLLLTNIVAPGTMMASIGCLLLVAVLTVCSYTDLRWRRIPNWATYTILVAALSVNLAASGVRFGTEVLERLRHTLDSVPRHEFLYCCFPDIPKKEPARPTLRTKISAWHDVASTADTSQLSAIGIRASLLGACACFGVMLLGYFTLNMGAGDVKLGAAVGALVGVKAGITVLLFAHLLAGAIVLSLLLFRRETWLGVRAVACRIGGLLVPTLPLPSYDISFGSFSRSIPLAPFFAAAAVLVLCGVTL